MSSVKFNYADIDNIPLKQKRNVQAHVKQIFFHEGKEMDRVNYIFCSDKYLLEINRTFLKHDFYTDIITFDLSNAAAIIGEVYISLDRVKDNAKDHSQTVLLELLRVIFHGALHLCGYKDKKKSEITIMRQKEDYYLREFEKNKQ